MLKLNLPVYKICVRTEIVLLLFSFCAYFMYDFIINIIYRQLGTIYTLNYIVILLMVAAMIIRQGCRCV